MTPREHMAEALDLSRACGSNLHAYYGATSETIAEYRAREVYRLQGAAAGHAFRALEIGYDLHEEAWRIACEARDLSNKLASEVLAYMQAEAHLKQMLDSERRLSFERGRDLDVALARISELESRLRGASKQA